MRIFNFVLAIGLVISLIHQSALADKPFHGDGRPVVPAAPEDPLSDWDCNLDNELTRTEIFSEIEKAQAKAIIGVHVFQNVIQNAQDNLNPELHFGLDDQGKRIRSFMQYHYAYTRSASYRAAEASSTDTPFAGAVATVPFIALAIGGGILQDGAKRWALKITGKSLMASGAAGILGVSFGQSLSRSALKHSATKLTLREESQLHENLYKPLDEIAAYLENILIWPPEKTHKFRKALHSEIFNSLVKAVKEQEKDKITIDPIVVFEKFKEIDLVSFLENGGYAEKSQIVGLRHMQAIYAIAQKNNVNMSVDELKAGFANQVKVDNRHAILNIRSLIRLYKIIESQNVENEPFSGERALVIRNLDRSLLLIRELCQLGALRVDGGKAP